MAADASRKVVVVRKKSEAQKVEVVAGPTPASLRQPPWEWANRETEGETEEAVRDLVGGAPGLR